MSSRSLENTIREIMRGPITEQVVVEGHFKVGDEVIYKGQEGEVVKLDTPQTGKYYHVELEDGKVIKASSDELKLEDEDEEEDEDEDEDEDEKNESVNEKTLTPAEKKKREEIAKAIERDQPGMPMAKKMAIATATAKKVAEDADLNELSRSTLSRYKDKASDARLHKNLPTSKLDKRYSGVAKAVKRLDAKEEAELDEAVTVKKQNYSWGKMMTVHHGNETSYPLHPEHQAKIKEIGRAHV